MNNACRIVKEIMNEEISKDIYGIKISKNKEWKNFNFIIGENGAGKSRLLKLIKENVKPKCHVIYLDFVPLSVMLEMDTRKVDGDEINKWANAIIFSESLNVDIIDNFTYNVGKQVLTIFDRLLEMMNSTTFIRERAKQIIDKLNPYLNKTMKRTITLEKGLLCLQKGNYINDINSEWKLLSPGEKSILVIVFAILIITMLDTPCILLIDEFENHLHPLVQIELLKLLKKGLEGHDHCTCIASHSIFLLPTFSIDEVVYINNGEIQKINGKLYQQIYDKLVGRDGKESLSEFLKSISSWQYAEYLAECFLPPITVDEANKSDLQAQQLKKVLLSLYQEKKGLINVLDFGAGSARIARCIKLMLQEKEYEMSVICSRLKYHIYDKYGITEDFEANKEWFGNAYISKEEINSDKIKFDIILLFNVLHEIGIDEWEKELNFILDLLDKNGIVLFGERRILSIGERPYGKSGYLVLGDDEIEMLFPHLEREYIDLPEDIKEVTICYTLKKKDENYHVTHQNIYNAIKLLESNSKNQIRENQIRENQILGTQKNVTINARNYAFYCQQYVNAQEALEILDQKIMESNCHNKLRLEDILQSSLPMSKKIARIKELAKKDTEEGRKCKRFLEERGMDINE